VRVTRALAAGVGVGLMWKGWQSWSSKRTDARFAAARAGYEQDARNMMKKQKYTKHMVKAAEYYKSSLPQLNASQKKRFFSDLVERKQAEMKTGKPDRFLELEWTRRLRLLAKAGFPEDEDFDVHSLEYDGIDTRLYQHEMIKAANKRAVDEMTSEERAAEQAAYAAKRLAFKQGHEAFVAMGGPRMTAIPNEQKLARIIFAKPDDEVKQWLATGEFEMTDDLGPARWMAYEDFGAFTYKKDMTAWTADGGDDDEDEDEDEEH
jgi:hypothetical protein